MRICILGKYPPIQGGVSRQTFWVARALAERGFEVHVVTNAPEVEDAFRIFDLDAWFPTADAPPYSGDGVTVHASEPVTRPAYIPWANPFVTKLAGMAADVIRKNGCELILGSYFEPYGMAAHLASRWTGVPYGLRHAGSDVGRLYQSPELRPAYDEMLRGADYVMTSRSTWRAMRALGIDADRLYDFVAPGLPSRWFNPTVEPMDIPRVLQAVRDGISPDRYGGIYHRFADKPFDATLPTIGIYGKTGEVKGSYDLVRALGTLRDLPFNLVAMTQGHPPAVRGLVEEIERAGMADRTWLIPFVPHWRVPGFLRACTAVCFLERNFPIPVHAPHVPREVLACGTCLVMSREILDKQPDRHLYVDGQNFVCAGDPTDTRALAEALRGIVEQPSRAAAIGMRGHADIQGGRDDFSSGGDKIAELFRTIHEDVTFRREMMSAAEMQSALGRLCVDGSFRRLFALEPENTLAGYKLTDEEMSALKSIDRKMLDMFAHTLKHKRGNKLPDFYPLLYRCVPKPELTRLYERFYALHHATVEESALSYAVAFGRFMAETLATDPDVAFYAADVARYEYMLLSLKEDIGPLDRLERINERAAAAAMDGDVRPRLAPGVLIAAFSCDIMALVHDLEHGRPLPEAPSGEHHVAFRRDERGKPHVYRISPQIHTLLSTCDGRRAPEQLAGECERRYGVSGLEAQVRAMLVDLGARGLVSA